MSLAPLGRPVPQGTPGSSFTGAACCPPPGMITAYGGLTAPDGWLLCDGSLFSPATYPDLAAVISTFYGQTSGSTLVADSGPLALHGTLTGTVLPSYVTSRYAGFGQALRFDGVDRGTNSMAVDVGTSASLQLAANAPFSIEIHAFVGTQNDAGAWVGKWAADAAGTLGNDIFFGMSGANSSLLDPTTPNNRAALAVTNAAGQTVAIFSNQVLNHNTKYVVRVTYDGTTLRLYINGNLDSTLVTTHRAFNAASRVLLGRDQRLNPPNAAPAPYPIAGEMDEMWWTKDVLSTGATYAVSQTPNQPTPNTLFLYHLESSPYYKLPDLRGRWPLGKNSSGAGTGAALGETGGAVDHTHGVNVTVAQFAGNTGAGGAHDHGGNTGGPSATVAALAVGGAVATATHTHAITAAPTHTHDMTHSHSTSISEAPTNPAYQTVNWIIKT